MSDSTWAGVGVVRPTDKSRPKRTSCGALRQRTLGGRESPLDGDEKYDAWPSTLASFRARRNSRSPPRVVCGLSTCERATNPIRYWQLRAATKYTTDNCA